MTTTSSERRLKSRIKIEGRMTYHLGNSSETYEGELDDLSNQGARIWIKQQLPPDTRIYCRIEPDNPAEPAIEFTATLLHNRLLQGESLYGYGCTIDEIELPEEYQSA